MVSTLARTFRREERWLGALVVFAILVYLSSGTGSDLGSVFRYYLDYFAYLIAYLFLFTRFMFRLEQSWSPSSKAGVWTRRFIFGDPATRAEVLAADVELVRGIFMLFFCLAVYSNVKCRIPFISQADGDPFFALLDRPFAGLVAATEAWFRGSVPVCKFFEGIYMHGYRYMMVLVVLLHLRRDTFALRWLFVSVCVTYLLAILITVAYPSMGPCFLDPARFSWVKGEVLGAQQGLAGHYAEQVAQFTEGGQVKANAFAGIAAFPSLHVGHMIIMMVVALRVLKPYAVFMLGVAVLTFIATVGFGWHYVVDAIGGAALAAGVTYLLGKRMVAWDKERAP